MVLPDSGDLTKFLEASTYSTAIGQSMPNVGSQMEQGSGSVVINQSAMGSGIGSEGEGMTSGHDNMLPVPDMTQKSGGVNSMGMGSSSGVNAQRNYVKIWEGTLFGQRQGQPVFICKLESYKSVSASNTLAADWPSTLQIARLIAQEHMNNKQYAGMADFALFRSFNQHGFLGQLQESKLCAVIQLPSQKLLLSVSDKVNLLIGLLLPEDAVLFKLQCVMIPIREVTAPAADEEQPLQIAGASSGMQPSRQPQQQFNAGISNSMAEGMQNTLQREQFLCSSTESDSSTKTQQDKIVDKPRKCKICGDCVHRRRRPN